MRIALEFAQGQPRAIQQAGVVELVLHAHVARTEQGLLFASEAFRRGKEYGAVGAEASWILEDNSLMTRPMEAMGARAYRRWRVYDKALTP